MATIILAWFRPVFRSEAPADESLNAVEDEPDILQVVPRQRPTASAATVWALIQAVESHIVYSKLLKAVGGEPEAINDAQGQVDNLTVFLSIISQFPGPR